MHIPAPPYRPDLPSRTNRQTPPLSGDSQPSVLPALVGSADPSLVDTANHHLTFDASSHQQTTVPSAFSPVRLMGSLPGLPLPSFGSFMDRLCDQESDNSNANRMAATARHLPAAGSRRACGRPSRGGNVSRQSNHIGRPTTGFDPEVPLLPSDMQAEDASRGLTSDQHGCAVITVVLPIPVTSTSPFFIGRNGMGNIPYRGLEADGLRVLVDRLSRLHLLFHVPSSTTSFLQLHLRLTAALVAHDLSFPAPTNEQGEVLHAATPHSSPEISEYDRRLFDIVRPGRRVSGHPGAYKYVMINTAQTILPQLRKKFNKWRCPEATVLAHPHVLVFVAPHHGPMFGHLPASLGRLPGKHICFSRHALHHLSHCVPHHPHLEDICLGVPCLQITGNRMTPDPAEPPVHSNQLPTRRSHSQSPPSSVTRPATRPRLASPPLPDSHLSVVSTVNHHLNSPFLPAGPGFGAAGDHAPTRPSWSSPHSAPPSDTIRSPARPSPSPSIVSRDNTVNHQPSRDISTRHVSAGSHPASSAAPANQWDQWSVIKLSSDDEPDIAPLVFAGFTVDSNSEDEDDSIVVDGAWQPAELGTQEYNKWVREWANEARREIDLLPAQYDKPFVGELYPGQPSTHMEPALQTLGVELSMTFWMLLNAAFPLSGPPSDVGMDDLRVFASRLSPDMFRVEITSARVTPSARGRLLTSGQSPSHVTFNLLMRHYLSLKPQAYSTTPDGYMALNPPHDYDPSDSLFWRGIGILSSLWLLYAGTPPFNISPFVFFVGASQDKPASLATLKDASLLRAWAPRAAEWLDSWDRLGDSHISDHLPPVTGDRGPQAQHDMNTFRVYLDALDIDLPDALDTDLTGFKLTETDHRRIHDDLLHLFLLGSRTISPPNHQLPSYSAGLMFFDKLRMFYLHRAFGSFKTFVYTVWQDITVNPAAYLLQRVKWMYPSAAQDASAWADIKSALIRFFSQDGLPALTASTGTKALSTLYELYQAGPKACTPHNTMHQPHIRRILLNKLVCRHEVPPGDAQITIEIIPSRHKPIGHAGQQAEHTTFAARVCFARLTIHYGASLHALAVAGDDGEEFDRIIFAGLLTPSIAEFTTL
ncbi:hypothetical protein DACRYDRAFT_119896 [Dacryopinax primogenitus]|uniref:Uncharacterized protein n=1 Tax=Dacryopinax primogenitus (strain DJM 731) TaxID=1858805 RepID=M5FYU7_DACPD|nr:uncharacterized protein DACRYDRAFT_119896 [Dacryopinax primogenitus]EJT96667.1 hypothetical protein DACRYDRAFT_119896 [Dacryopinax primogenitus]